MAVVWVQINPPKTGESVILAIDPGSSESAYIILEGEKILKFGKEKNEDLLRVMKHIDFPLAIEMIASYGMPVGAEVFETCVWIGRFIQAHGGKHRKVFRKEVKMHICGSMKAKDGNVRQALIDRFGPPGTKKKPGKLYGISADVWSALAVGLTYQETPSIVTQ